MWASDIPDMSTGATELLQGPMAYSHHDLVTATNNFSKEYKLGEGAFGEFFKVCGVENVF